MRYSEEVLSRVRDPKRVGSLDGDHVGTGEVGTLDEGTVVRIQVKRDGDRIAQARFKVFGCSAAIASASLVAELLESASIADAKQLTAERIVLRLDLAPERVHVAQMAVDAGLRAIESAFAREEQANKGEIGSEND